MRIAVLEAVCAGLCGDNPPPSLLAEGLAMWHAMLEDLLAIPGMLVDTIVGAAWSPSAPVSPRLRCVSVANSMEALLSWQCLLKDADADWIIAPESDTLLERLVTISISRTATSLNAVPSAIRLCADKLALAAHLQERGIATVPTTEETWQFPPSFEGSGFVVKPRDGAGSQLVRQIQNLADWQTARSLFQSAAPSLRAIRQPFIAGKALSIAGWFHSHGVEWFPVAEQKLSTDGCFTYLGGMVPARVNLHEQFTVRELAERAAVTIPGLRGYIGFDVVLSDTAPVLVEINPRLTTSCLSIRKLCHGNWLESLISHSTRSLSWHSDRRVEFTSEGVTREVPLT